MIDEQKLKDQVIEKLQTIYDPEIPVNIYELGLIYEVTILPVNNVQIVMTLTAWVVYRKLGLGLLRTAWFNVDWLWAAALVVAGMVVLLK